MDVVATQYQVNEGTPVTINFPDFDAIGREVRAAVATAVRYIVIGAVILTVFILIIIILLAIIAFRPMA